MKKGACSFDWFTNSVRCIGKPGTYQFVEQNRPDYYKRIIGPVRVLSAPKTGTIGKRKLQLVLMGDWIFEKECEPGVLYWLPASNTSFSVKPLSREDNLIAEENTPNILTCKQ